MGKTPGSGRKKGAPNKATQDLFAICAFRDLDVFEEMVLIAVKEENPDKKFDKLKEIAQYLYPKRKAMEISTNDEGFKIVVADYTNK